MWFVLHRLLWMNISPNWSRMFLWIVRRIGSRVRSYWPPLPPWTMPWTTQSGWRIETTTRTPPNPMRHGRIWSNTWNNCNWIWIWNLSRHINPSNWWISITPLSPTATATLIPALATIPTIVRLPMWWWCPHLPNLNCYNLFPLLFLFLKRKMYNNKNY